MRSLKSLLTVAVVAAIGVIGYRAYSAAFPPAPCSQPISYSLAEFDTEFGLSKSAFLGDLAQAAALWDTAAGKSLFAYDAASSSGDVAVNLVYDDRQAATDKLVTLDTVIKGDSSTYDAMKATYDSYVSAYQTEKTVVTNMESGYQTAKQKYDSEVSYWNARGGAPNPQYQALEQERAALDAEAAQINQAVARLNTLAVTANASAADLNQLATNLNHNVKTYTAVGVSTGPEFDEGEYVEDASGRRIDIYQYSDRTALIRVLAHELGHALGMQHVAGEASIMYAENKSQGLAPTAEDLAELARVCHMK